MIMEDLSILYDSSDNVSNEKDKDCKDHCLVQQSVSDEFRQLLKDTVKEVVVEKRSFETQKKWLRRFGEKENLEYDTLEQNLTDLFEAMDEGYVTIDK